MAKAKLHHHIPQFLLRRFSSDEKVSCYRITNGHLRENQLTKSVAAENHFYGEGEQGDLAEQGLSEVEGRAAEILRRIDSENKIPLQDRGAMDDLTLFVSLQITRNKRIITDFQDSAKKMMWELLRETHRRNQGNPNCKISSLPEGVMATLEKRFDMKLPPISTDMLRQGVLTTPFFDDLQFELLSSPKDSPFIIPESGTIAFNLFHKKNQFHGSGVGIAMHGICILLPIGEFSAIAIFDDLTYRLKPILLKDDVAWINEISVMSSEEQIYWGESNSYTKVAPLIAKKRASISPELFSKIKIKNPRPNGSAEIFHTAMREYIPERYPAFITLKKFAKNVGLRGQSCMPRNQALLEIHQDFMSLVWKGEIAPQKMREYINRRMMLLDHLRANGRL